MKEIIKLGLEIKVDENKIAMQFEQKISNALRDIITEEAFEKVKNKLEETCEIISEGIKEELERPEEDNEKEMINKAMEKVKEEIESCNNLDDLFNLLMANLSSM